MQVTAIKQQVRRPHRYSIFLDNAYAFSLSERDVIDNKIIQGKQLSLKEVKMLKHLSQLGVRYEQVVRYIQIRLRSRREIEEYLKRKEINKEDSQRIIDTLLTQRLIDDERFAQAWITSRRTYKQASQKRIVFELKSKGIDEQLAKRLIAETEIDDSEALRLLIEKKRRLSRYQDSQKLMRYLVGQGYSYGDVKEALKQIT